MNRDILTSLETVFRRMQSRMHAKSYRTAPSEIPAATRSLARSLGHAWPSIHPSIHPSAMDEGSRLRAGSRHHALTALALITLVGTITIGVKVGAHVTSGEEGGAAVLNASETAACVADILSWPPSHAASLLQIGAHLGWGDENDQLRLKDVFAAVQQGGAVALLVEPQPRVFSQLNALVEPFAPHFRAVHSAVCAHDRPNVTLYAFSSRLDARTGVLAGGVTIRLPKWASQIASLDRESVMRNLPGGGRYRRVLERHVVGHTVRCDSVRTVLARQGLGRRRLRVLAIDAEGRDAEILASLDLSSEWLADLSLVLLEHKHSPPHAICAALRLLHGAGFVCECDATNIRCVAASRLPRAAEQPSPLRGPARCCRPLPHDTLDPWGTCARGARLHALRGLCFTRSRWAWSQWRLETGH